MEWTPSKHKTRKKIRRHSMRTKKMREEQKEDVQKEKLERRLVCALVKEKKVLIDNNVL